MIHHQRSLVIDASPQSVWAELARFMHVDDIAPQVVRVEALSPHTEGLGAKRRCIFADGNSVVEEVTAWQENRSYRVRLSDTDPMPLHEAYADLTVLPHGPAQARVVWGMTYRLRFGPLGWLMGQTMMKWMMSKILDGNLHGLAARIKAA